MHKTNLRKVGSAVMLEVPSVMLELLQLEVGSVVNLAIEGSRLIVAPTVAPHYSIEELLAQCDDAAPMTEADREWLSAKPVGTELL